MDPDLLTALTPRHCAASLSSAGPRGEARGPRYTVAAVTVTALFFSNSHYLIFYEVIGKIHEEKCPLPTHLGDIIWGEREIDGSSPPKSHMVGGSAPGHR